MSSPPPDISTDRRPLAARNLAMFRRMSTYLASHGVSPNAISVASVVFGTSAGAALAATNIDSLDQWRRLLWIAAAAFIQLRLLMNMLDGMVAMELGRTSPLGELYNEIPDRISDAATLVGFGYAQSSNSALGYVAACLAIFVAYIRAMGRLVGAPQQYCGPMAKPHRMLVVTLAALYCGLAPDAWHIELGANQFWTVPTIALAVIIIGAVITAVRRLYRISVFVRGTLA
jgi:phosphatidylglycerophosphate synthase